MAYKYFNVANQIYKPPKENMLDLYQHYVDTQFTNASDWFKIEEELLNEVNQYQDITVRLNSVVQSETGTKLSDDFRKIIFQDMGHARGLGYKYRFDDSIWLAVNYDIYGKATASCTIRKCRNVLKWIDPENGALVEEPCVFDNYALKENSPFFNAQITIPAGYVPIAVQSNTRTKKIKLNQRFYFNGLCYKVWSIFNALNTPTFAEEPLIGFLMGVDEINNQEDDVINNIANYNSYNYKLNILEGNFYQNVGFKTKLNINILLNGGLVERNVLWSSDNLEVGTVDNEGNIELVGAGTVNFLCQMVGNPDVSDTITVTVTDKPLEYREIIINPECNYILQGMSETFTVYQYVNGLQQDDTFSVEALNVPKQYYILQVINGNEFTIINVARYMKQPLTIKVTNLMSGEEVSFNIELRGVF